jgi:hypothetical protein
VARGRVHEGELEAAAVFVDWIESGFPEDVRVMDWAGPEGSGVVRMKASDLMETAVLLLCVPLPMPYDLAAKVRELVATTPVENELEDDEPVKWSNAIWDLRLAFAWRQEHAAV